VGCPCSPPAACVGHRPHVHIPNVYYCFHAVASRKLMCPPAPVLCTDPSAALTVLGTTAKTALRERWSHPEGSPSQAGAPSPGLPLHATAASSFAIYAPVHAGVFTSREWNGFSGCGSLALTAAPSPCPPPRASRSRGKTHKASSALPSPVHRLPSASPLILVDWPVCASYSTSCRGVAGWRAVDTRAQCICARGRLSERK
jgi:hypothetical protein